MDDDVLMLHDLLSTLRVILVGLEIGRSRLLVRSVNPTIPGFTNSSADNTGCDVIVVPRFLSPQDDPFFFIDSGIQLIALVLLGLRVRTSAIQDALMRPESLIATLVCQLIVVPLVNEQHLLLLLLLLLLFIYLFRTQKCNKQVKIKYQKCKLMK